MAYSMFDQRPCTAAPRHMWIRFLKGAKPADLPV